MTYDSYKFKFVYIHYTTHHPHHNTKIPLRIFRRGIYLNLIKFFYCCQKTIVITLIFLIWDKVFYPEDAPLTCPPASRRQPLRSAFSIPLLSLFQHPFFLFFFFFFSQYKSGMRKAVFFSIEFSGHLSVLLRPSILSFFFRLFFGLNPVFMRVSYVSQWQQSADEPVSFSGFYRIFFSLSFRK